jgi:hypothetical protein
VTSSYLPEETHRGPETDRWSSGPAEDTVCTTRILWYVSVPSPASMCRSIHIRHDSDPLLRTRGPARFFRWHQMAASSVGAVSPWASFSVSSLPGLKLAPRFAAMVIVSPVRGLRPWRSFRSFTTKLPNPPQVYPFVCSERLRDQR